MRRHELDVFSLVAGLVLVAVAVGHLLDVASDIDVDGRWVAPVVLVALGVAGLAGVLRGRDGSEPAEVTAATGADEEATGSTPTGDV